jgi:hypothetical protein
VHTFPLFLLSVPDRFITALLAATGETQGAEQVEAPKRGDPTPPPRRTIVPDDESLLLAHIEKGRAHHEHRRRENENLRELPRGLRHERHERMDWKKKGEGPPAEPFRPEGDSQTQLGRYRGKRERNQPDREIR